MSDIPSISLPRRLYHRAASFKFRNAVNDAIKPMRRWRNALRWRMMTPAGRTRYTNRRLMPEQSSWLFVLGLNNSGTTLLSRLVGMHPEIRDLGTEGQNLTNALPAPRHFGVTRVWTQRCDVLRWTEENDSAPTERVMFDWAGYFDQRPGYLLEKSPPHLIRSRWLQANFQPCRFISVTRNPYAVCEGISRRVGCDIRTAATHWATAHQILLEDLPHLHKVLRISYEQLAEQTETVLREVETFLELSRPFSRELLSHEFTVHNMANQAAAIQNFNARSIDRLSDDDIATITEVAGDVMQQFGYEPMSPSSSSA